MEVAGTSLAIVATIDLCLKYGPQVVALCRTYRDADVQFAERVLQVRSTWKKTSLQLVFVRNIAQELDPDLREIQEETLSILVGRLRLALTRLEGLNVGENGGTRRKLKFAVGKSGLDNIIQDLSDWQARFDPSWLLLLRLGSPIIDVELRKNDLGSEETSSLTLFRKLAANKPMEGNERPHVSLPPSGLAGVQMQKIPRSTARFFQQPETGKWLIADNVLCYSKQHQQLVRKNIRTLAQKLSCGDPDRSGLLRCRGFTPSSEQILAGLSSFELLFYAPQQSIMPPKSLRASLQAPSRHNLTQRIALARQFARAVSYVHALGFVHKNVRPETIVGFSQTDGTARRFFLVGFEQPRLADGQTMIRGDNEWHRNLYRHPTRQGLRPEETFVMQHDMYSLGVCLLEIGLWQSSVVYDGDSGIPMPNLSLGVSSNNPDKDSPLAVKARLVQLAEDRLPGLMGEVYSDIVLNCLTCLDEDNADFGDESEFVDEDGVLVGVRYIEKVLMKLDEIVV
ncbi:unnamed protein product [Zymoseptoria tritici ST99CH_3D1]|uniref:Protein kinase domain-containing protein n=1 Tax=Zymoseptoria tritici ST99CH_1E4 TaxID=1276532 RepID=A0A2H1GQF2_ZYMTR|nr:unnamed protein product [Zymoseptoria tritici ST99CH_1E4]SMR58091.1 unnamed protein product [Zymoseptoria tritici ST99CH_3D1]